MVKDEERTAKNNSEGEGVDEGVWGEGRWMRVVCMEETAMMSRRFCLRRMLLGRPIGNAVKVRIFFKRWLGKEAKHVHTAELL